LTEAPEREWRLQGFEDAVLRWYSIDDPPPDLSLLVTDWWFTRLDDPFAGAQRDPQRENGWYTQVPGSAVDGHAVLCSWVISVSERTVTCDAIALLPLPIL